MGLLDIFGADSGDGQPKQGLLSSISNRLANMTPEESRALAAFSASLAETSGPSLVPTSGAQGLGRAMMAGYKAYDGAMQMKQAQSLRDMQVRELQGTLEDQDLKRKDDARLRQFYLDNAPAASTAAPTPMPQQAMASAMPGGPMSPKIGGPAWLQAYQADQASAPPPPSMAAPQGIQGAPAPSELYAYHMGMANKLRAANLHAAAEAEEAKALKVKPEYSQDPKVGVDQSGKPFTYVLDKEGNPKILQGVLPRDKMAVMELGGYNEVYNPYQVKPGQRFNRTLTPGEVQTKQRADADGLGPLTPEAIDNAAARYNFDGTLPPMGMGKAAAAGRSQILNRAAQMAAGIEPGQQREQQLGNRNDMAARGSAVRSFSTGKDGQAVQSANTALNHLETIRSLAEAQKSGDVRAFNQAARALGAALGQSAPTNLNAALIMVAPEISKAVVGVGGTGHERDQAIQALNPNGSPEQIIGSTETMQELFGGRLTEAKRTYERTTLKKDFDTAFLSPAAQKVLAKAQGANQGGGRKVATLADIAETARRRGISTKQVTADLKAAGWTIGGQ